MSLEIISIQNQGTLLEKIEFNVLKQTNLYKYFFLLSYYSSNAIESKKESLVYYNRALNSTDLIESGPFGPGLSGSFHRFYQQEFSLENSTIGFRFPAIILEKSCPLIVYSKSYSYLSNISILEKNYQEKCIIFLNQWLPLFAPKGSLELYLYRGVDLQKSTYLKQHFSTILD